MHKEQLLEMIKTLSWDRKQKANDALAERRATEELIRLAVGRQVPALAARLTSEAEWAALKQAEPGRHAALQGVAL